MNTLKKLSVATAGAAFIVVGTVSAAQALTLESGKLGSAGENSGFAISNSEFLGWKFQLNSAFQVTGIGGHLYSSGNIFGAIVALSGSNALPQGDPFNAGEVLASTTFNAGSSSSDAMTPLSVKLDPGNYGLVFGTGQFGATGSGGMPYNNVDFPGSKYFSLVAGSPNLSWFNGGFNNTRFVVEGNPVVATGNLPLPVPFEFSPGLGILALGGWGAMAGLNSFVQKRKSSGSGFHIN